MLLFHNRGRGSLPAAGRQHQRDRQPMRKYKAQMVHLMVLMLVSFLWSHKEK